MMMVMVAMPTVPAMVMVVVFIPFFDVVHMDDPMSRGGDGDTGRRAERAADDGAVAPADSGTDRRAGTAAQGAADHRVTVDRAEPARCSRRCGGQQQAAHQ